MTEPHPGDGVRNLEWQRLEKLCRACATLDPGLARQAAASAEASPQPNVRLYLFYLDLLADTLIRVTVGHAPTDNELTRLGKTLYRRWNSMLGRPKSDLLLVLQQASITRGGQPPIDPVLELAGLATAIGIMVRDLGWQDWAYIRRLFAAELAPMEKRFRAEGLWET